MGVACRENPEALGPKSELATLGVKETAEDRGEKKYFFDFMYFGIRNAEMLLSLIFT